MTGEADEKAIAFGNRLRSMLRSNRMSQRELADEVGITYTSMSRYVNGNRIPRAMTAVKMANSLHTTMDHLLGLEDERNEAPEDSDAAYQTVKEAIAKHGNKWSQNRKAHLVIALFGD